MNEFYLKIISLAIFTACFCRNEENNEYIDGREMNLNLTKNSISFQLRKEIHRLNKEQLIDARQKRLKEIQIDSILRDLIIYSLFLIVICLISYSNRTEDSFYEVQHLRKYFLNQREIDNDYTKVILVSILFF